MIQNLQFDAVQKCDGRITISDNLPQLNYPFNNFITVDIVTLEKTDGPKLVAQVFTPYISNINEATFPVAEDGYYNITHLVISTKSNSGYIAIGTKIYNVETKEEVDPLIFTANINTKNVTKLQKSFFFTKQLWDCYTYLSKQVLDNMDNKEKIKELEFKRDFIWATLYVIKYLVEDCKLEDAQEIIEQVSSCNGFCLSDSIEEILDYSCGLTVGKVYKTSCGCSDK